MCLVILFASSPRRATRNIDRDFMLSELCIVVGLLAQGTSYLRQTSSAGPLRTSSARLCTSSTSLADRVRNHGLGGVLHLTCKILIMEGSINMTLRSNGYCRATLRSTITARSPVEFEEFDVPRNSFRFVSTACYEKYR
jgi:hypothetical protein